MTLPALGRRDLLRGMAGGLGAIAAGPLLGGCDSSASEQSPKPSPATGQMPFPDDFLWGAATSAYQIEGAATEDGRGESIWDRFSHTPGRTRDGGTGDVAADHYHRYEEDLDLMAELGLRGYRFSVSWPRVLPEGAGRVNRRGLDFYRRLVDGLLARGIRPMATLFHWDLPQALQDQGGWESRDTAYRFADYAELVFDALPDVPVWVTINEPKTVVDVGYIAGVHAPGKRDESAAFVALHHLLLGHGLAVRALRATGGDRRIAPALNLAPVYTEDEGAEEAVKHRDGRENRLYLDPVLRGAYPEDMLDWIAERSPMLSHVRDGDLDVISTPIDLLAVQYYNPISVSASGRRVFRYPTSEASWQEIHPEGLYDILTRVRRDYGDLSIEITENGLATPEDERGPDGSIDDSGRVEFLRDHLAAAHRARGEGVRLEGYHLWSLLDNFEWAEGYTQRWGIVHVDFETQHRTPKRSAGWYRDVIAAGGL